MANEREHTEMGLVPLGSSRIAIPNHSLSNIEPTAALAAGFNAEANFLAATHEVAALKNFDARANGYLTIAQGKLLVGRPAQDEIRLAVTSARDYRDAIETYYTNPANSNRTSVSYVQEARKFTGLMLGITEAVIRSGDPADSLIQDARTYIQGYHVDLDPDDLRDSNHSHERRMWVDRRMGQIEDSVRLAEVVIRHPEATNLKAEDLVQEIKALVMDAPFVAVTAPRWNESHQNHRMKALASLTRLQVMTHDLPGAEETLEVINKLSIQKNTDTNRDDEEYRGHDPVRGERTSKIEGLTIAAALQAKVASELNLKELTTNQVEAVIKSGNVNAIRALGYHGLVDAAETLDREDISEPAKDLILQGIDNKLADEEQKIKAQRQLLAARRKALG